MKNMLICAMFLLSAVGFAQEDITVTVLNTETSEPVANAAVLLVNNSQGFSVTKTTNTKGTVVFTNIAILNGYQVIFEGDATYGPSTSGFFDVRSNQDATLQLRLSYSLSNEQQLQEVVVSSNTIARVNRKNAEVSFELQAAEIEEMPIEGRDITRVLYRLPNVTQATGFYAEAPNVSINGANPLFTNYTIDGLDNNERFLGGQRFAIPSGFVKNVTVLTSNYSAEYGLTNNGVIDITTKSGSNELKGEAYFITRPGPVIDGESQFAQRDLSGNQVKNGFARYQVGGAVGGALVQDKTFFFINLEHTTDVKDNLLNSPDLGVNATVRGSNSFTYFSTKLDQIWSPNFRSSLRANIGIVGIERQGGGLDGGVAFQSAGNTQDRNSINLAFKNSYRVGLLSAETNVQYSRFRWNYANPNNVNDPQVVVRNPADETIAILGHPGYAFDALENTIQLQQKAKYYANNHTIKAGFNFISGNHLLFGGGTPNGNYTVRLSQLEIDALRAQGIDENLGVSQLPSTTEVLNYSIELRPASFGKTQNITSFYVEDLWKATDKLNLTFGLRYDYDNLSKGGSTKGDVNNLAPRLNFNYKLTDNSSLRGGYAIAYDKINYAIYSDALQQNTTSEDYKTQLQEFVALGVLPSDTNIDAITHNGNIAANVSNVGYLQGPTAESLQGQREGVFSNERRILNPNGYQNPYSHQFSLGYQVQADADKLFFIDLFHNRGEDLFRIRNLNAAAAFPIGADFEATDVRSAAAADASRPIPITNSSATINGATVTGVARNVIMTESEGRSAYYAASFNLQKTRGNDAYAYRINYTLSSLKNDTEDINFRPQDGNNYGAEWGASINDRTHNINGIYSYYPWEGTTFTVASLLQSGQPINRIPDALIYGTTDLNGDGSGFGDAYVGNSDRSPGEQRNSDRLPWSFTTDIGVQHQFKLANNTTLELRADVFNVFNTENLSGYSNNATQSNQIQAGPASSGVFVQRNAGPPRQFQFGARFLF